jgi:hypothetical protein
VSARSVLHAKDDIRDILYRMAERHGLSTRLVDEVLDRHLGQMFADLLAGAAQELRSAKPQVP